MVRKVSRGVMAGAGVIAVIGIPTAPQAQAHSFYEYRCCSDRDCKPVAFEDIGVTPDGYLIKATGTLVPYSDARIRPTPLEDVLQRYHLCTVAGKKTGSVICLYVPQGGV